MFNKIKEYIISKKSILQLSFLYLLIVGSITLRVNVEATGYMSPDSEFYLRVSENILNGKGIVGPYTYPFNENTPEGFFSIWPLGYPLLIVGFSYLTVDLFWASKMINFFFLGCSFLLLCIMFHERAVWASFAYFSYGLTEVYSYTWSEGAFLFFMLLLLFGLRIKRMNWQIFVLSFSLSVMFILRYAGFIFWIFILGYLLLKIFKKDINKCKSIATSLIISGFFISNYFILNYIHTGYLTGANRVFFGLETWNNYLFYLGRGIINIFAYARNIWFSGNSDTLAASLLFIQIALFIYLFYGKNIKFNDEFKLWLGLALFYFLTILVMRVVSPFDAFNYRIFSPISLIIYLVFFMFSFQMIGSQKLKSMLVYGMVLASYLVNLPVYFLYDLIFRII